MSLMRERLRGVSVRLDRLFFAPADPRSYAAVRIGFGIAALCILIDLWPLRLHLFADTGLVGGGAGIAPTHGLNLFAWIHSERAVTAFMAVSGLAMMALIAGVATRLAAGIVYLWAVSYSGLVTSSVAGYDVLLRLVGFSLLISPVVGTWSLTRNAAGAPSDTSVPIYGLRLVQWQVFLVYISTAVLKLGSDDWLSGDLLAYYWMSLFSRFPHPIFADFGLMTAVAGWFTLAVELTVPFLLWSRRLRWLGVALGVTLHVGIAITSKLALFGLAMLALYPAFFETRDFDAIVRRFRRNAPA
jgi:hypothetical protein